jgi:hypothetical protein
MFMVKDSRNFSICYTSCADVNTLLFCVPDRRVSFLLGAGLQTIRTWLQKQAAGSSMNSMEESALH